ncbi:hypothetical protein EK21DRAFT_95560 [Setomelanomma holmii]|uniref:Uncharacterized protein n=1 Tax=Setomelanomma holmii TaxID=210430 RepID=A0A9P4GWS4_9PLEO|nr:hypothetical protein EK21DRAFT_95560 [Setomelanomma holmii]
MSIVVTCSRNRIRTDYCAGPLAAGKEKKILVAELNALTPTQSLVSGVQLGLLLGGHSGTISRGIAARKLGAMSPGQAPPPLISTQQTQREAGGDQVVGSAGPGVPGPARVLGTNGSRRPWWSFPPFIFRSLSFNFCGYQTVPSQAMMQRHPSNAYSQRTRLRFWCWVGCSFPSSANRMSARDVGDLNNAGGMDQAFTGVRQTTPRGCYQESRALSWTRNDLKL